MRLPNAVHASRPWRIHALVRDFSLEDVWALPTPGGPHDFGRLVHAIVSNDPSRSRSLAVRALFALRWQLGAWFGWDDPDTGIGERVATLRDRLPADLRDAPAPRIEGLPFSSIYLLENEFAAEIANRTVHAVMHLGWVADGDHHRGEMAVYAKPNGVLGAAYMSAIRPFRHALVYPQMVRQIGRRWSASA